MNYGNGMYRKRGLLADFSTGTKLFAAACTLFALAGGGVTLYAGKYAVDKLAAPVVTVAAPARTVRAEGTLLASPKGGMNADVARLVEPGLLSIAFADKATAWEFYNEAVGNGEAVCLSDLGPQLPEHHGQRYWLRTC